MKIPLLTLFLPLLEKNWVVIDEKQRNISWQTSFPSVSSRQYRSESQVTKGIYHDRRVLPTVSSRQYRSESQVTKGIYHDRRVLPTVSSRQYRSESQVTKGIYHDRRVLPTVSSRQYRSESQVTKGTYRDRRVFLGFFQTVQLRESSENIPRQTSFPRFLLDTTGQRVKWEHTVTDEFSQRFFQTAHALESSDQRNIPRQTSFPYGFFQTTLART